MVIHIKECGKRIYNREKVYINGKVVVNIKEIIQMDKEMDLA